MNWKRLIVLSLFAGMLLAFLLSDAPTDAELEQQLLEILGR